LVVEKFFEASNIYGMKVIIVRHAQTDENAFGKNAVRTSEVLLNEEGVRQAKKLGEWLKSFSITHAYVSPQKRAVHTAQEILAHHANVLLQEIEELREQNLGIFENASKNAWREFKATLTDAWHLVKPEKGESYHELQQRAAKFFKDLFKKHSKQDTVLLVSHGGTLGVLLLDILEKELTEENYRAHQPKNSEFTVVEIIGNKPRVHTLNSREHLDE
jgi:broad specificity phosphatase PhoE